MFTRLSLACSFAVLAMAAAGCTSVTSSAAEVVAQAPPQEAVILSEWGNRLVADATAVHHEIAENHPGSVDPLNPAFARTNDDALALALQRAVETTDAAGWWWALREYASSFDDAHLDISLAGEPPVFQQEWAGFITAWRAGHYVVVSRDEALPEIPAVGARLIGCDGQSAEAFASERVGRFRGRWFMNAQKITHAPWLFRDTGNPWSARPKSCEFEEDGLAKQYAINWYPVTLEALTPHYASVRPAERTQVYLKQLDGGGYWIAMPVFAGSPDNTFYPLLTDLMAEIAAKKEALRAAPFVVLDVRDNDGGSSRWSDILAESLWGEGWMKAHPVPQSTSVDWRASAANLAALEPYAAQMQETGDPVMINWIERVLTGLRTAIAQGEDYWVDTGEDEATAPTPELAPVSPVTGKVFVLTDAVCFSACLDAVDRWKMAGGVQIGQITGADTVYIENRSVDLPSGMARLHLSMKVYRDRHRGNNEPQIPNILFDGDINDDVAVEAWVRSLAAR